MIGILYSIGLFEKKTSRESLGHTFLTPPNLLGIFRFFTLPLEILGKTNLHP